MAHDDDKGEEWSPEDDRIEHKFLKRLMKKMDAEDLKEVEKEKTRKDHLANPPARFRMLGLRAMPMPPPAPRPYHFGGLMISIRPIENGFVFVYNEAVHHEPPKEVPPPGPSEGLECPGEVIGDYEQVGVGAYISTRQVEVFVKDAGDSAAVLAKAMDSIRELHKLRMMQPIVGGQ